jgi:hypothetical protein
MPEHPDVPRNRFQEKQQALRQKMAGQHPFHEELACVYEQMGGQDALLEWAEENPGKFFDLMMKASPPPQSNPKGGGLSLTLALHPALAPGPLDVTPNAPNPNALTIDHGDD